MTALAQTVRQFPRIHSTRPPRCQFASRVLGKSPAAVALNGANMSIEWRPVVGYEGAYEVSNTGLVRRSDGNRRGSLMAPSVKPKGYLQIGLTVRGIRTQRYIHRLVAEAFIGSRPTGFHQINHRDNKPGNNHADNLEWVTPAENHKYSMSRGRSSLCGDGCSWTKLTSHMVEDIKRRLVGGQDCYSIARHFGVDRTTIRDIKRNKRWRSVAWPWPLAAHLAAVPATTPTTTGKQP